MVGRDEPTREEADATALGMTVSDSRKLPLPTLFHTDSRSPVPKSPPQRSSMAPAVTLSTLGESGSPDRQLFHPNDAWVETPPPKYS